MATLKPGDKVIIGARDQTAADVKSGLYYSHFANLRGAILKLYGEEASVLVERETLPTEVRLRHEAGETAERQKYLDKLSETARSGLGEKEKNFKLNYAVLVSLKDVRPDDGKELLPAPAPPTSAQRAEAKVIGQAIKSVDPLTGQSTIAKASESAGEVEEEEGEDAEENRRLTENDLSAAEEEFLNSRNSSNGSSDGKRKGR